jgi:tRNA threonylcarbamoyladenosine biosynthesis protein TsaE
MGQPESLNWKLANTEETLAAGALLAGGLTPFDRPVLVGLVGPLGAGKTTLARGLLQALGVKDRVKSPSYTLVEPYQTDFGPVYHLDLYRLADPGELEFLGLSDFLDEPGLTLVEWPEKAPLLMRRMDCIVSLDYSGEERTAVLTGPGEQGKTLLARLPLSPGD